jgi:hypothetical protein
MRKILGLCVLSGLSALMLGGCVGAPESGDEGTAVQEATPSGKGAGTLDGFTIENFTSPDSAAKPDGQGKPGGGSGITYHGGPVMTGTVNMYYIFYGNVSAAYKTIVTDFANSVGGSAWNNINTTYYNSANVHVSNSVTLAGTTSVGYTHGTSLSDATIETIVKEAITAGLPSDTNGIYFVLTDPTVTASSGFCTQYCGWHDHGSGILASNIKYSFVGDPARCPSSCQAQNVGPNGSTGADGAISIIAHELVEAASDPELSAWWDSRGYENADKCAWTFGTTYTSGGASANVHMGTRDYLIQRNWVNAGAGSCAVSYP